MSCEVAMKRQFDVDGFLMGVLYVVTAIYVVTTVLFIIDMLNGGL